MATNDHFDCVLLVDDDIVTNYLNEVVLDQMQIAGSIEKANNVEDALRFIETCYLPKENPKNLLILLDVNMGGLDGFDFLDDLNSRTDIPLHAIDIIILSSSKHSFDVERAEKYTILDYLEKPLTPEKLYGSLKRRT